MVERGEGKLLYTASISGTMPTPYEAVYGGTKAFLISFVESVKQENIDSGVSFTLLLPGEVDTPFWHRAGMDTSKLGLGEKAAPTKVAREGYDAMKAGKDRVVSGKPDSKFIGRVINTLLPDTAKAAAHAEGAEPGSGLKA
jgi:short-subunit dehydrogenase